MSNPGKRQAQARAFGDKVRTRRRRLRLSQQQVADRAGLNRVSVARIEAGQYIPNVFAGAALAAALHLAVEDLVAPGRRS